MIVSPDEKLLISPNKTKIGLFLVISLGFVVGGFWILSSSHHEPKFNPVLVYAIGISNIIFFGVCALTFAVQLCNTKPSVVLDAMGIIDNSSAVSVGRILWQDIDRVSITQIENQKFLTIHVNCPEKYLQRGSWFKRKLNDLNNKIYGSPIHISTNMLSISLEELNNEISRFHEQFTR